RGGGQPPGALPGGAGGHALPGRGGRHAPAAAGEAAAGPGGEEGAPGGLAREPRRGRARDRGDPQEARGEDRLGGVSRGPLLPAERGEALHPGPCRAPGGHSAACQPLSCAPGRALPARQPRLLARGDAAAGVGALAGQRAPAPERDRAGGGARRHRGHPRIARSPGARRRRHGAHSPGRGAQGVREGLPGANPQDHRGQRDQGGAPGGAQPHRVLPPARAPLARARDVQGFAEGEGKSQGGRMTRLFVFLFTAALGCNAFAQSTTGSNAPAPSVTAQAQNLKPDELVKKVTDDVLSSIKSDKQLAAGDKEKALQLAEQKVLPLIDFDEATRLAVGRAWKEASKEQQQQLVEQFRRMLVRTYSNALGRYEGQTMKVLPSHYKPEDTDVTV